MTASPPTHLLVGARSVTGLRRRNNQDSGHAGDLVAVIADGVGGAPRGDLASATIVRGFVTDLPAPDQLTPARLRQQVAAANAALRSLALADPELQGMATTCTGLVVGPGVGFVVHIGDSRCYLLRNGRFEQATVDQSWVQMLISQRLATPAEAKTHPMRNLLLHSLSGALRDPETAQIFPVELRPGDRWLLATDGLSDYLPCPTLEQLTVTIDQPQDLADALVDAAYQASRDNISVIVADVVAGAGTGVGRFIGAAQTEADAADRAG